MSGESWRVFLTGKFFLLFLLDGSGFSFWCSLSSSTSVPSLSSAVVRGYS